MTKVCIEQDGDRFTICAEGHAGATDACNFITGIMYAFAGYAKNAEAEGFAEVYGIEIDAENARFLVHCRGDERVEASFDTAVIGLRQLEAVRPQNISITLSAEKF